MMRTAFLILVLLGALAAVVGLVAGFGLWQTALADATEDPTPQTAGTTPAATTSSPAVTPPAATLPSPTPTLPAVVAAAQPNAAIPKPPDANAAVDRPGDIVLRAANAVVQGFDLRLEGEGFDKRAVNWVNRRDALEWPVVQVPTTGIWEVELEYASDGEAGGGMITLAVGRSQLFVRIDPTGGWNDYRKVSANMFIRAGEGTVLIRPTVVQMRQSLMNLKGVRLRLVSEEPENFGRRRFRQF
jgi:hypothetical protein